MSIMTDTLETQPDCDLASQTAFHVAAYVYTLCALPAGVAFWVALGLNSDSKSELAYALAYGPIYGFLHPWAMYAGWTIPILYGWIADQLRLHGTGWRGPLCLAVWHDTLLGVVLAMPADRWVKPLWEANPGNEGLVLAALGLSLVHLPLIIEAARSWLRKGAVLS